MIFHTRLLFSCFLHRSLNCKISSAGAVLWESAQLDKVADHKSVHPNVWCLVYDGISSRREGKNTKPGKIARLSSCFTPVSFFFRSSVFFSGVFFCLLASSALFAYYFRPMVLVRTWRRKCFAITVIYDLINANPTNPTYNVFSVLLHFYFIGTLGECVMF